MKMSKTGKKVYAGFIILSFVLIIGIIVFSIANFTTPSTGFEKVADYVQEKPRVEYHVFSYKGDKTLADFKAHIKDVWKLDNTTVFFYYDSNTDVSAIEKRDYSYTMLNEVYKNKPDQSFIWYPIQGIKQDAMFYLEQKVGN